MYSPINITLHQQALIKANRTIHPYQIMTSNWSSTIHHHVDGINMANNVYREIDMTFPVSLSIIVVNKCKEESWKGHQVDSRTLNFMIKSFTCQSDRQKTLNHPQNHHGF